MTKSLLTLQIQKEHSKGPYRFATLRADTQSVSIDLATYDSPYERLLEFIQNIISGIDEPNSFSYKPEGNTDIKFYTAPAIDSRNVYFHVGYKDGSHEVKGIFIRRQLATVLLTLCDDPIRSIRMLWKLKPIFKSYALSCSVATYRTQVW